MAILLAGGCAAVVGACSSPELALADLSALHTVETAPSRTPDGAPGPEEFRLAYRDEPALYGGADRMWHAWGMQNLAGLFDSWIQPSPERVDDPEVLTVELFLELEGLDLSDVVLVGRSLEVLGSFVLREPSPLARRRCAVLLGRIGRAYPEELPADGWIELDAEAVARRYAELARQLRLDFEERLLVEAQGGSLGPERLQEHRLPIAELARLRGAGRLATQQLLEVLAQMLRESPEPSLREELERTCRALVARLTRQHLGEALRRRDPSEVVRGTLAVAWLRAEGLAGFRALEDWIGADDSEEVRRALVAQLARYDRASLQREGALSWLARRAEDDRSGSSRLAVRVLRPLTQLDLGAGEDWTRALGEEPAAPVSTDR